MQRELYTKKVAEFKKLYGIDFDENLAYANGYIKYPEGREYTKVDICCIQKWVQYLRDFSDDVGLEEARMEIILSNYI